ncbi:MAG: hypothetical protein R2741_03025 [Methanolobus sp.]
MKRTEKILCLREDFEKLTAEEKFDVVEFQNAMLQKVSNHSDMYGIPKETTESHRDANEIISHMSPRSLDYSQQCISYYMSKISSAFKKQ